jgi:hypothetical protein
MVIVVNAAGGTVIKSSTLFLVDRATQKYETRFDFSVSSNFY